MSADSAGYGELNQAQFSISGLSDSNKRLSLGLHTTDNGGWIQSLQYGVSARALALQPNGGAVAIGTTDPQIYKLYVAGITYSRDGYQPSDLRFKKEVTPISDALNTVLHLNGVSFVWNEEYEDQGYPTGKDYGIIAQEVAAVLPEAVKEGPDGEKAVSYTKIVPFLIETIKAQQMAIEALKLEIAGLKAKQ